MHLATITNYFHYIMVLGFSEAKRRVQNAYNTPGNRRGPGRPGTERGGLSFSGCVDGGVEEKQWSQKDEATKSDIRIG